MVHLDFRNLRYPKHLDSIVRAHITCCALDFSRILLSNCPPYQKLFKIPANEDSLISAGAVIASDGAHINLGNDVMMLGLVSQVVTLGIFGALAADVYFRIRKFRGEFNESTQELRSSGRFKYFLIATIVAYACISIRCVYRIAEMAGGWRNKIMEDEVAFVILDGVMVAVAVLAMNFFHPGFVFKHSYATLKAERMEPELEMHGETVRAK
jgi:hypothetical protein